MKNFSTFSLMRMGVLTFFALGGLIFAIAFIDSSKETIQYQNYDSRIGITNSSFGSIDNTESNYVNCEANIVFDQDQLIDISSFQFNVPIHQFRSNNQQFEATIQQLLNTNHSTQITFTQQKIMVLPIMKMIHLIGELNIANVNRRIGFRLSYSLNQDKSIYIKGKEVINLSDFGLNLPNRINGAKNEVTIDLDFKMIDKRVLMAINQ